VYPIVKTGYPFPDVFEQKLKKWIAKTESTTTARKE
jgi:hypothetical protein